MEEKQVLENIANKIKYYRELKGFSQEQLSERAGVHRTYISTVECAKKKITVVCLAKIANALDISIKELL